MWSLKTSKLHEEMFLRCWTKSSKIKKSAALLCYKVRMDENDVIISSTEIIKGKSTYLLSVLNTKKRILLVLLSMLVCQLFCKASKVKGDWVISRGVICNIAGHFICTYFKFRLFFFIHLEITNTITCFFLFVLRSKKNLWKLFLPI